MESRVEKFEDGDSLQFLSELILLFGIILF